MIRPDQAEVREAVAPWAYECVGLEKAGHKGLYLAAIAYTEQWSEGSSDEIIAREVAKAGFQLSHDTVYRRRQALEGLRKSREPSSDDLQAFADALSRQTNPGLPRSAVNEWYTPVAYIESVRTVLGDIDLDPASCTAANETIGAGAFYSEADDGLTLPWTGRVFLNPPWHKLGSEFAERLMQEHEAGHVSAAIGLFNAHATDQAWFQPYFRHPLCFTDHRIDYDSPDDKRGSSMHGSVFAYLGDGRGAFASEFRKWGAVVVAYQ